ncbi:MAG: hypothetical protein ABFR50_03790 [Candidatus Fermentibacteria bacterium]
MGNIQPLEPQNGFKFGLIGWPLDYSLSPAIYEAFFRSTGLGGEYAAYPVLPAELKETLSELLCSGITGLNVTCPHKAAAASICNELESHARELKVINTMHITHDSITGYNTDVYGFNRYIDECGLSEPFYVMGSGSAALAVDYVLNDRHLRYEMYCRNPRSWHGIAPAGTLEGLNDVLLRSEAGTVVNATTLGWGDEDIFPVEKTLLRGMVFADLNYNSSWHWRNDLPNHGADVFTGETMLVHQAAGSFEIWTGVKPSTDAVLETIKGKLEETKKGCDSR